MSTLGNGRSNSRQVEKVDEVGVDGSEKSLLMEISDNVGDPSVFSRPSISKSSSTILAQSAEAIA